jgi:hypothetical protein
VIGLTLMGVAMTIHNWTRFDQPDPFGVGIGVAPLIGALIAFVTWFLKRA